MALQAFKVTSPKGGTTVDGKLQPRVYNVSTDLGQSLAELSKKWGEAFVYELALSQMSTNLGNSIRRMMNDGKSDKDIAAYVASYDPRVRATGGVSIRRMSNDKISVALKDPKLSPEKKQEILAEVQRRLTELTTLSKSVK